jgi:hypothetical protein
LLTASYADDHETIGKVGPVAYCDCGIKDVAIHNGDCQGLERAMKNQAR